MVATDDRALLLRTQAVQACLTAMGGAQVRIYGDEAAAGVVLDSEDTMTSSTLWRVDGERWRYDVTVHVAVNRRKVDRP